MGYRPCVVTQVSSAAGPYITNCFCRVKLSSTPCRLLGSASEYYLHSKPKNVFLHFFCVRMCAKCVIKCLFGTHGVTNVFHYRKISVTSKEKCYKNVPLTLWIAYSHIPNSMCFICVKKKSLKLFRCHIYLLILTHREWNVL